MGTLVIDTNIIAFASSRIKNPNLGRLSLYFLNAIEFKEIKIGTDQEGVIEKEYKKHIEINWDTKTWWKSMMEKGLINRFSLSPKQKGPYPDNNLSEVDKMLLDVASMTDTKILVTEDSDFYEDKSLESPHPVVEERGVKLKKLSEAYREVRAWDP